MSPAFRSIDHDEIRAWVEERAGNPARVKAAGASDDERGLLRIDFPGHNGEGALEHVSWDEWFEAFDASDLAFLAETDAADDGYASHVSKLVHREPSDAGPRSGVHDHSARVSSGSPSPYRSHGQGPAR